jgi:hypothetical protein
VELGVRILGRRQGGGETARSSGRAYLFSRAEQRRAADRLAHDVHRPLARLASESVVSTMTTAPTLLAATYLIDREKAAEFRARAEQLAAGLVGVRAFVTGPWPPYSFVQLGEQG